MQMTNPLGWFLSPKISALVTDTGGALSHPRRGGLRESGVPVWVGTRRHPADHDRR